MKKFKWIPAFTALAALLLALPASAGEFAYAPEGCEFRLEFPGEPYNSRRCATDESSICREMTSYTKVFRLDATLNINVTCNPAEEKMYERYDGDVMQATLSAMLGKNQLDDYQTGYQEFDVAKEAVLLGTGPSGNNDRVLVAQLWIGHKSVFSVEAEIIGESPEADEMFSAILGSIRHESWNKAGGAPKPAAAKTGASPAPDAAPQDKNPARQP